MSDTKDSNEIDNYYTLAQVAERFGVKTSTVRLWVKQDRLKAIKVMNRWRVSHEELKRVTNEEYGA